MVSGSINTFSLFSASAPGARGGKPQQCAKKSIAYLRVKKEGLGIPLHTQLFPSSSLVSHLLYPFQGVETRAMSSLGLGQPHWEERISFYWLVCEVEPGVCSSQVSTQPLIFTASPKRKGFWALRVSLTVPTPDIGYLSSYH